MSSSLSQIFYFIPEDGESPKQMNCFIIRKAQNQVTQRDVRNNFPIPGDYVFRFQYSYKKNAVLVWLDLCNEDSPVPQVDQEIRVKVTRQSWKEGQTAQKNKLTTKEIKLIDQYIYQQDAERQIGTDQSMGSAAMSMFTNIASQAKNVLGGVATQVANSMPVPPNQLHPQSDPPQQFRASSTNQYQQDFNQNRAAAPVPQKQQNHATNFDDLF